MKRFFTVAGVFCLLGLLLSGCKSADFYRDRAVQRARDFVEKNAPELTFDELAELRYGQPVLLTSAIIGESGAVQRGVISHRKAQILVSFVLADGQKNYLVYGVSSGDMQYWRPERLIRKKLNPSDNQQLSAIRQARELVARDFMRNLSVRDYNFVRFNLPQIEPVKVQNELPVGRIAVALTWLLPESEIELKVYGVADNGKLENFQLKHAELQKVEDR